MWNMANEDERDARAEEADKDDGNAHARWVAEIGGTIRCDEREEARNLSYRRELEREKELAESELSVMRRTVAAPVSTKSLRLRSEIFGLRIQVTTVKSFGNSFGRTSNGFSP